MNRLIIYPPAGPSIRIYQQRSSTIRVTFAVANAYDSPVRSISTLLYLLIATLCGGCTRFDAFNAISPTCGDRRAANLSFGKLERQKLDVWTTNSVQPNAKVIVFFYGGEWQAGEKWDYRFVAKALAARGFVVVLPDYRVYPEVTFPAFVDDGALAVRWVHDHIAEHGGDPTHVYLMGHSAGAHIAALLNLDEHYLKTVGLDRSAIRATIALSGPYDFTPFKIDEPLFNMRPGGPIDPQIEPVTFADGTAPPMLLIHGEKDETCAISNLTSLAGKIRQHGGQVDTIIYPTRGHSGVVMAFAWSFSWLAPTLDDVTKYVQTH